jgi:hypothetical protein
MAKDAEVASLFQLYQCRATDLLRSHRGQVAGAVIEAQTFISHCNEMLCQQVTLSGYAEWSKVAEAVIEAKKCTVVKIAIRI